MGCDLKCLLTALAIPALLAGIAGRGGSGPTIVPVTGRVTLDDEPVEGATVMMIPAEGRPATGLTDTKGEFRMTTLGDNDGAVVGNHRITVSLVKLPEGPIDYEVADSPESLKLLQHIIPARYDNPKTSGLTAEVRRGMEPLDLNLTR